MAYRAKGLHTIHHPLGSNRLYSGSKNTSEGGLQSNRDDLDEYNRVSYQSTSFDFVSFVTSL